MRQKTLERPVPRAVNALSDEEPAEVLMRLWNETEQAIIASKPVSQPTARRQKNASAENTDRVRYAYD
jgi:hypothetical protein